MTKSMKYIQTSQYLAKHAANIALRMFLGMFLFLAVASVYSELLAFIPHVAFSILALYVFSVSFAGSNRPAGIASAATQADIFNITQLQKRNIVLGAIYNHYGWSQDANGNWDKGNGREIPAIVSKLRLIRHDLYQTRYLTIGQDTFKFFDQAGEPNRPLEHNFLLSVLPPEKMWIFFGLVSELATGAGAGTDTSDALLFTQPSLVADAPVLSSQVSFKMNGKTELDRNPYRALFINDDAYKGFHRFEEPIVWEPGGAIELEVKLAKAYAGTVYRYMRNTLIGIELTNA